MHLDVVSARLPGARLVRDGNSQFLRTKATKRTLAIEIEHVKVVWLMKVPHGNVEVSAAFSITIDLYSPPGLDEDQGRPLLAALLIKPRRTIAVPDCKLNKASEP